MRKSSMVISVFVFLLLSGHAIAEVTVKEESLTWDKTARLSGDQLYGNLCSACHGSDGKGNGLAAAALDVHAPDLTVISATNNGTFPHKQIERLIARNDRHEVIGDSVMPSWEQQFMYVRTGLSSFQREAYARNRIHVLTEHLESLQQ
jgi:mono/diheme cytochrome c family protein